MPFYDIYLSMMLHILLYLLYSLHFSLQKVPNPFECFNAIVRSIDFSGIQVEEIGAGKLSFDVMFAFGNM